MTTIDLLSLLAASLAATITATNLIPWFLGV